MSNDSNRNDLEFKFLSKVPCHSHGDEALITKKNFVYKFLLPSNTIFPNGYALEWTLWRKWDDGNWTMHSHQGSQEIFQLKLH